MKKILFIALLFSSSVAFSQLPKTIKDSLYIFTDIPVNIENGHGDKVKVLFSGKVDKNIWTGLVQKNNNSEKVAFDYIAWILSLRAQSSLKNELSFEPLKKQLFFNDHENFICDYKMMGRNGYGNLQETSVIVTSALTYSAANAGDSDYVPGKVKAQDFKAVFDSQN